MAQQETAHNEITMNGHRLSIRAATIIAVTLIGTLFIIFSLGAGSYFREAALESQTKSLSRIIEVASNQVLREIQTPALNLHSSLNEDGQLARAFNQFQQSGDSSRLLMLLDDPLRNGFQGMTLINLVKLRLYDTKLNFLLESRGGRQGITPQKLPQFIRIRANKRKGGERFKAIGGLWVSSKGPIYSILLPVGGLSRLEGYIELLIDPASSLARVKEITSMPVTVTRIGETAPREESGIEQNNLLPIEYRLIGDDNRPAYLLIGKEDVGQLYQDMHNNQVITSASFVSMTFVILMALLFLLNRNIFQPLKQILRGIEQYRGGELETRIRPSGLKELYTLGETFNSMIEQLRLDINELERYSHSDGLTGLSNRRYFEQRLKEEWSRATRQQQPISILFIDIDYFKRYNDHYGHLKGDDSLRRVAEAIQHAVKRDIDVAARYGGEEFVIMLPDTDLSGAEQVARELQQAIRKLQIEHHGSNIEPFLTLSIGIASDVPAFPEKPEKLLHAADTALYYAKAHGRNRIDKAVGA